MNRIKASVAPVWNELSWRILSVAFFGSMASTGFGFDQGWWGGALSSRRFTAAFGHYDAATESWAMSETQQSIGTGLGTVAVVVGLVIGTLLNERLGRWRTLLIQPLVAVVGIIIEATTSNSYAQLIVGRVIVYIAGGIATNVVPVYQAECSTGSLRGLMTTTYNGALMLGALASSLVFYLSRHVDSQWSWKGVVIAQLASPILCLIGLLVLPESPSWLVTKRRLEDAAHALQTLRGPSFDTQQEINLLQRALDDNHKTSATSYLECFKGTNLRRTIIIVGVQVLQQALGIPFIANYLGVFLVQIGFTEPLLIVMLTYVIGVVASLVTMVTIDAAGRRSLLLYSATLLAAFMFVVAGLTHNGSAGLSTDLQKAAVALLLLWFAVFQVTWGPIAWIVTAEIPGSLVREKSVAISAFSSYAVGCAITFANPYVMGDISGKVGFIYGSFAVLAVAFVFFCVPEVKKRSLAEIDELFNQRVPTRKFPSYNCQTRQHDKSVHMTPEEKTTSQAAVSQV
ncbi:Ff.00g114890.m01.CDS01 [Fusarium sp. VM40]|nr:Ff.00g114890.m01.CDS01 [Fusarium sp. VM40]